MPFARGKRVQLEGYRLTHNEYPARDIGRIRGMCVCSLALMQWTLVSIILN